MLPIRGPVVRTVRRHIITGPRFTPTVNALPSIVPFVAPEEMERSRGAPFKARLGANESTFGPSPKAIAAMQAASTHCWMYGDPKSHELRLALADHLSCAPGNLVVGEGIDGVPWPRGLDPAPTLRGALVHAALAARHGTGLLSYCCHPLRGALVHAALAAHHGTGLLSYCCHLLVGEGDTIVSTGGTYPTLNYFVAGRGGHVATVPYGSDQRHDLGALVAKAHEVEAKLVYVVNPDNPSGTWHAPAAIEALVEQLPPGCLLLLDEAYADLCPGPLPEVAADDLRVLRLRTFSKGHGLAGARVGYAVGEAGTIAAFDKVRNHFGVSRVAQAGALAALADAAHLAAVREKVSFARQQLELIASSHGLTPLPSGTNFVTMDCGRDAAFARAVLAELLERGLFVRMPGAPPLDRCIRVSCAGSVEIAAFREALPQALEGAINRQAFGACY